MSSSKVSLLLPDLRGGGAERMRIVLAHEFSKAGYDVEIVVMQAQGEFLKTARDSFRVIDLEAARMRTLPRALFRYFQQSRPDVLIAAMWPLTVIAPLVARLSGVRCKVLISEHGILSAEYRDWGVLHNVMLKVSTAIGYRLAAHRIGVSKGLVEDMAQLSWMRPEAFNVIHNPIPASARCDEAELSAVDKLWSSQPGSRILTVGTMKEVKNHALLLRAFARVRNPNKKLMFVGTGSEFENLQALAESLKVIDQVIFAGFHSKTGPFYETADLFVLSSDSEGFGNVLVEALAAGTPVVSTDCPSGPAEILGNGRYGRLTPVGDEEALAEAMELALNEPTDRKFLKQRAQSFTPEVAIQKYLGLIEAHHA